MDASSANASTRPNNTNAHHFADVMGPPVGGSTNVFDQPFSARFQQGNSWEDMSDKDTCPISEMDAAAIASGHDPFMTGAEEAAYETKQAIDALKSEAVELAVRAGKAEFAADYDRYHAGLKLIELREMVRASGSNVPWGEWVERHITGHDKKGPSRATVYRYMAFAKAQDAKAENVTSSHAETSHAEEPKVEEPSRPKTAAEGKREQRQRQREDAKRTADKYAPQPSTKPQEEPPAQPQAESLEIAALKAEIAVLKVEKDQIAYEWSQQQFRAIAAENKAEVLEKLVTELREELGWTKEELELETKVRKSKRSNHPFTPAEVRQLSMAFHPDANLTTEKRTELFKLWNSKVG
jgi:hypothetical protein